MKPKLISETYKTINYKYTLNGEDLVVIFPRAAAIFDSHAPLFNLLTLVGFSVMFLETGYFGITRFDSNVDEYNSDNFCKLLNELLTTKGNSRLIFIGESVGAVHAANYANLYPQRVDRLILVDPAFYRPKPVLDQILKFVLFLGFKISPARILDLAVKICTISSSKAVSETGQAFSYIGSTIGGRSFLNCLSEIVKFRNKYSGNYFMPILAKSTVVVGAKDEIFKLLCDGDFCKKYCTYVELPGAAHGILDTWPDEIKKIVSKLI